MIKRVLLTFFEFICFCALFYIGGYWAEVRLALGMRALANHTAPPPMVPLWKLHINSSWDYVANGWVYALTLLVLILLVQAFRKRLHPGALLAVLAFLAAFGISLLVKSGFVPLT